LTSDLSPQRRPTLRNVSQSVAGPMRDTSCAGLAARRESELLCIRTSERVASGASPRVDQSGRAYSDRLVDEARRPWRPALPGGSSLGGDAGPAAQVSSLMPALWPSDLDC
jgi:hypothetical protein